MRKIILISLLMLVFVAPVLAQGEPGSAGFDQGALEAAIVLIINTLVGLVMGAFGGSPIVAFIVSVLKKISLFDRFSGEALTLGSATVVYVIAGLALHLGFGDQFDSVVNLIVVAGPAILSFLMSLFGSKGIFVAARNNNVPLIGYQRTP